MEDWLQERFRKLIREEPTEGRALAEEVEAVLRQPLTKGKFGFSQETNRRER